MSRFARNTLAKTQLENFKNWLINDGWIIEESPKQAIYEVLRAIKKEKYKNPLIVYVRDKDTPHYTLEERWLGVIGAFLRDKRSKNE